MKMFRFLCVFSILFIGYDARDQIVPPAFRAIFPYASLSQTWKLTFHVNRAATTLQAMTILDDWAPYYWRTQNATLNPKSRLSNMTFAVGQGEDFLQHRSAVRQFLRYMFRTTVDTKYFVEKDAEKMRDIFWDADLRSKNDYTLTRTIFKNHTTTEFAKTHKDFGAKFENLTSSFYYLHISTAQRLNWTLQH